MVPPSPLLAATMGGAGEQNDPAPKTRQGTPRLHSGASHQGALGAFVPAAYSIEAGLAARGPPHVGHSTTSASVVL